MKKLCKKIRPLLSAYGDGELAPTERQLVEEHLNQCEECRQIVKAERSIKVLLREHCPRTAAPFELRARIRREMGRVESSLRLRWGLLAKPVLAFASAVAVLLVVWAGYRVLKKPLPSTAGGLAHVRWVHGRIECVNCYLAHKYHVKSYCKEYGHELVFLADDGEIYYLIPNEISLGIRDKAKYFHDDVEISGWFFYPANAVELESIRPERKLAKPERPESAETVVTWRNGETR